MLALSSDMTATPKAVLRFESIQYFELFFIQKCQFMLSKLSRDAIISFGHSTSDCCNRVAVSANGDCISDRIFKSCGFKKSLKGLRDTPLTRNIEGIALADAIQREVNFVIVLLDVVTNLRPRPIMPSSRRARITSSG